MLKTTSATLMVPSVAKTWPRDPTPENMSVGTERSPPKSRASPKNTGASTTLTSGPATATLTSSMGLSGSDFILASPPMGRSVMS